MSAAPAAGYAVAPDTWRADAGRVAELHDDVVNCAGPVAQTDDSGAFPVVQFSHARATDPIEAVR